MKSTTTGTNIFKTKENISNGMSKMTLSEELQWRGFVNQTTLKDIKVLDTDKINFYFGVDPSADSMTIGNLASAMMVRHFISHGHTAYLLVGGATGMIGDPDGKVQERDLLTLEQLEQNKIAIENQYKTVFSGQKFEIVDNYSWFSSISYLGFLRDIGKHVPMRQMLGREFVQSRLGEDGAGISYAEFSYSLIQGYDFLYLNRHHNVLLQLCGADQWGNSIAGVDLIRRIEGKEAHVWSAPLVINKSTGKKFGKSEDGAVWLDEQKTSVYKFYQFWINLDDEGVEDYIKVYTTLSKEEVDGIMTQHNENKSARIAQKRLAYEVTKIVHGEQRAKSVQALSETLFSTNDYSSLSATEFEELKSELPSHKAKVGDPIVDKIVEFGLASSKGEARRFLQSGAVYVNGQQLTEQKDMIEINYFIDGYSVFRRGKNLNVLVEMT